MEDAATAAQTGIAVIPNPPLAGEGSRAAFEYQLIRCLAQLFSALLCSSEKQSHSKITPRWG